MSAGVNRCLYKTVVLSNVPPHNTHFLNECHVNKIGVIIYSCYVESKLTTLIRHNISFSNLCGCVNTHT